MKKIASGVLLLFASTSIGICQCPTSAGGNKTVCSNIENSAYPVQIGPQEPYPGAWSGFTFSWSPSTGLDNPNVRQPYALPDETTTYTLTVSGPGCSSQQFQMKVIVAGVMFITNPDGTKNRVRSYYDLYYPYEGNYTAEFSNEDPNAVWVLADQYGTIFDYNAGSGLTYNFPFTGLGDNWVVPQLYSVDANNIGCYTDQPQIRTHGVYSNGYPVTVTSNYYAYSACGPTLPATISQVSTLAGQSPTCTWTLEGANSSNWSITSPSGSTATLNRTGGTPPVSNDIHARAYIGPASPVGQYIDGYELWMRWGIGYHSGTYPTCYPMTKKESKEANNLLLNTTARLLPNPARNSVVINSANAMQRIMVYNTAGILVKQVAVNKATTVTLSTVGLSSGLYVVRIVSEKGLEEMKMIKE